MEFTCKQSDFLKTLQKVSSVSEKKTTMPILGNLLFDVRDQKLTIFSTDLEISMQSSCAVGSTQSFKFCTPAHQIVDIIKRLPDPEVKISKDEKSWLHIQSGRSKFRVACMEAEEFPEMPRHTDFSFKNISSEILRKGITHTLYAMSSDEMRPNLNGILIEKTGDELRLVSTDGHRLALYQEKMSGDAVTLDKKIILPRKGIMELKKIIQEEGSESLQVAMSPANAVFQLNDTVLYMKLVVGDFPDYGKVIPQGERKKLIMNRSQFSDALKRVSLLSEGKSKCVKMHIHPDHVHLSANSPELGEADEDVAAEFSVNEELTIGFNAKYLLDALMVMDHDKLVFELDHEQSPGVIKIPEQETYCSVVMPMRI